MSEIDVFLDLLDDKELEKLSKLLKLPVKNNSNSEVNKIRLKQNFKSGNKSFNKFIAQNKDEKLSELTQNEFLIFLRYFSSGNYPNHKKFINYIAYFPEKVEETLPKIEENIKKGRHIFDFNIIFDEADILSFTTKTFNIFDKHTVMDIIDLTFKDILKEKLIDFGNVDIKEIKNYNLSDLYKNMDNKSIVEDTKIKYLYVKTHEIEEPLYSQFLLNICCQLLVLFKPYFGKMNDIEKNNDLVQKNNVLDEDNKELRKIIKKQENIYKELEKNIKENRRIKEIIDDKQKEINIYKSKMHELDKENQNILKNFGNLQSSYNDLEEDLNKVKGFIDVYEKKINDLNLYFDVFSDCLCDVNIVVIFAGDRYIVKKLYEKEVVFKSSKEVNENGLLDIPKNVKCILIERNGINSESIREIKKRFENQNVIISIINPGNDKELLEEIVKWKQKVKEAF